MLTRSELKQSIELHKKELYDALVLAYCDAFASTDNIEFRGRMDRVAHQAARQNLDVFIEALTKAGYSLKKSITNEPPGKVAA